MGQLGRSIGLDELERDPHPVLARLLVEEPVTFVDRLDMWFVTRWDDVVRVCEHPEEFRAETEPSWLRSVLGENMLTLDGARHDRLADAMRPPFVGASGGAGVRDELPRWFDELIDGFVDDGEADLMTAYAEPLANLTLQRALGFHSITWQQLAGWCRGVCTGLANFENDPAAPRSPRRLIPSLAKHSTHSSAPSPPAVLQAMVGSRTVGGSPSSYGPGSAATRSSTT